MCGIAGIVGPNESKLPDAVKVHRMLATMRHRGPDDEGVCSSEDVAGGAHSRAALGACRLAILDLSPAGHQPLVESRTGATIVFNGEIYNFAELRRSLVRDGVELHSHSDTEVILHLFLRHGPSCLQLLEGMFAIAIWDPRSGELFLARDRLGVKPLYLAERDGCMLFASEVRALLASGVVARKISKMGVASYLRFGAVREPYTIIDNVGTLDPGTWLRWSRERRIAGRFWRMEATAPKAPENIILVTSHEEALARVRELFLEGVRLRLTSDVPVVTFLSGGVDSTSVVAAVKRATGEGPDTIGVTFAESGYSEAPFIDTVVKYYGCRHYDRRLTAAELLAMVPRALSVMDQPTFDGVNTYVVSDAAAERGFKVALSGIGGDELFGGYPTFRLAPLLTKSRRWLRPRAIAHLAALGARMYPRERGKKLGCWFLERDIEGDAYDLMRQVFSRSERELLLGKSEAPDGDGDASTEPVLGFGDVSRRELSQYLRNVLLRDTDCFGMACSLEVREPFLYTSLVEQVLDLPDVWKVRGVGRKPLLSGALSDLLPREIQARSKRGFTLPFAPWMRTGGLRADVGQTLSAPARDEESFNPSWATSVWDDFQRGGTSWNRVWALYVLRKWMDENIDTP